MRSKTKILKDIDAQISNIRYGAIDNDLDDAIPSNIKKSIIDRCNNQIKELEDIKNRLGDLLI